MQGTELVHSSERSAAAQNCVSRPLGLRYNRSTKPCRHSLHVVAQRTAAKTSDALKSDLLSKAGSKNGLDRYKLVVIRSALNWPMVLKQGHRARQSRAGDRHRRSTTWLLVATIERPRSLAVLDAWLGMCILLLTSVWLACDCTGCFASGYVARLWCWCECGMCMRVYLDTDGC